MGSAEGTAPRDAACAVHPPLCCQRSPAAARHQVRWCRRRAAQHGGRTLGSAAAPGTALPGAGTPGGAATDGPAPPAAEAETVQRCRPPASWHLQGAKPQRSAVSEAFCAAGAAGGLLCEMAAECEEFIKAPVDHMFDINQAWPLCRCMLFSASGWLRHHMPTSGNGTTARSGAGQQQQISSCPNGTNESVWIERTVNGGYVCTGCNFGSLAAHQVQIALLVSCAQLLHPEPHCPRSGVIMQQCYTCLAAVI